MFQSVKQGKISASKLFGLGRMGRRWQSLLSIADENSQYAISDERFSVRLRQRISIQVDGEATACSLVCGVGCPSPPWPSLANFSIGSGLHNHFFDFAARPQRRQMKRLSAISAAKIGSTAAS